MSSDPTELSMEQIQEIAREEGWRQGARAAKMTLLAELNVFVDQQGWVYTETEQLELEKIAVKIDEAADLLSEAVEQLNRVLDRIRTGR